MRRGVRLRGIKVVTKASGRRYLYRRVKGQLVPLPDLPENHPEFLAAYEAAGKVVPIRQTAPKGSIAALCQGYLGSREFARLAPSTRAARRRIVDKISQERGKGLVADLRPQHLRKDVRALTPGAASMRLKAWRGLLAFAVDDGWIETDPSTGVRAPKGETRPHRQWSPDEIAGFRHHWPPGSPERIAFEVIYWTGARCIDAVRLGNQMIDADGWLNFTQQKTGGPAVVPATCALPHWATPLADDHRQFLASLPDDRMQWIVTRTAKPRSHKGMSQWFSRAASTAGLPDDCTAHGLRKARAAALAEINAAPHQIGAWTGHESLAEIAHYTRAADKKAILAGTEQKRNPGNRITLVSKRPKKDQ